MLVRLSKNEIKFLEALTRGTLKLKDPKTGFYTLNPIQARGVEMLADKLAEKVK